MLTYTITKEADTRYSYKHSAECTVFIELCTETKRWTLYRKFNNGMRNTYCHDLFASLEDAERCLYNYINKLSGNIFTCH